MKCKYCYGCDGPANCQNHCECHEKRVITND